MITLDSMLPKRFYIVVGHEAPSHARERTEWYSEAIAFGWARDHSHHYACTCTVYEIGTDRERAQFLKGVAR